jgi:hypothetical protein
MESKNFLCLLRGFTLAYLKWEADMSVLDLHLYLLRPDLV